MSLSMCVFVYMQDKRKLADVDINVSLVKLQMANGFWLQVKSIKSRMPNVVHGLALNIENTQHTS